MTAARRAAVWALPCVFCLLVYRPGLGAWFRADDFAWLNLSLDVHGFRDLLSALFAPKAQGTVRPWSERGFFLLFYALFGLDALPFRIAVFATQIANLVLLGGIARRLSPGAEWWAPLLWAANNSLGLMMSWTSAYNQAMWAFFMLLAFYCLLRYVETGASAWNAGQWTCFLLGFGALESNAVYPAIAAAYTWMCARRYFRGTLLLFGPAACFLLLHRLLVRTADPLYFQHFDWSMPRTLLIYWEWTLGPARVPAYFSVAPWIAAAATVLLSGSLLGYAAITRDRAALFGLAWFAAAIAPFIPMRDHVMPYYPAIASAGIAMAGAAAMARMRGFWRAAAAFGAIVYLAANIPVARRTTQWSRDLSERARWLVLGVARAHQLHPGKAILLDAVAEDVFWNAVLDRPFRLFGIHDVYLAPGTSYSSRPEYGDVNEFVLPPGATLQGLENETLVVYSARGPRLKNITSSYEYMAQHRFAAQPPSRIDAGSPLAAQFLGSTWYPPEDGHRWMPRSAMVRIASPQSGGSRLRLAGVCPEQSATLRAAVGGQPLPPVTLQRNFDLEIPLARKLAPGESAEISLEVDHAVTPPGDRRQLGLAFGTIEIR